MEEIQFKIGGKIIRLEDNAEIINLLRNDDQFTVEFFQKAFAENRLEKFGIKSHSQNMEIIRINETEESPNASDSEIEMMFESAETVASDTENTEEDGSIKSKKIWTSQATKLLLSVYQENICKVGKSTKLKNKKVLWKVIRDEMMEKGYDFTPTQIQNRYKTLDRGYKEKTINNKKTGRNRASCEFECELSEINQNNRAVFPDFLLDSDTSGKNRDEIKKNADSAYHTDSDNSGNTQVTAPQNQQLESGNQGKRINKSRTILEEIKQLREIRQNEIHLKEEREEQRVQFRNNMLQIEKAKLEAYKERNRILQQYCQSFHKDSS